MKRFHQAGLLFIFTLIPFLAEAQYKFRKCPVAETGVNVYFPADPGAFDKTLSQDSAEIYTAGVFTTDSLEWVSIVVKLKNKVEEENRNGLLMAYLDYLKEGMEVVQAVGYGEGHTLEENPGAVGMIDYWEDAEKNVIEIKGWINSSFICVMFVAGPKNIEKNFNATRLFFNSVRFP